MNSVTFKTKKMEPFKFSEFTAGLQQMSEVDLLNTSGGGIGGALLTLGLGMISPALACFHMGVKAGLRATD
jgi:hypothetical protein